MFDRDDPRYQSIEPPETFRGEGPSRRIAVYDPANRAGIVSHPLDRPEIDLLHKRLLGYYGTELELQGPQRLEMREDEKFYDGEQWSHADAAFVRERGQMPLVFNVIAPAINWMLGSERMNRTQYKILPREKSDARAARLKTEMLKYIDDANNSDFAWSQAYADAVKVGLGWIEEGWQGDSGEEPIFLRTESWRNIVWDSRATGLDLADARYLFRAKWVDLDVAARLFPGPRNAAVLHQSSSILNDLRNFRGEDGDEAMDDAENAGIALTSVEGSNRRRLRLIEAWYRTLEERPYVSGGQFRGELFDAASPGHTEAVESGKSQIKWRTAMTVRVAILTAAGVLWDSPSPYRHNRFPFTPVWGNRRGGDNMPYGLIRPLKDIQRDINKRHSKALHILNASKVIMDSGAVDDIEVLREEVASPDAVIVKNPGKELIIDYGKELAPAQIDLMSRSIQMIQQTSGITDEAMGRQTNANSGKAILARQQQGSVATAHFLDNLRLARRLSGEKMLSLIEQFCTEEKAFRITNSRGTPEFWTVNDADAANDILRTKADFVISEDAWRATQRQAEMQELMALAQQIAPVSPEIVLALLDLFVEAQDLPSGDEIVGRIRKITGQTDPDMTEEERANDPELQARAQADAERAAMEKRGAEAQIAKTEAEASERQARAAAAANATESAKADQVGKRLADRRAAFDLAVQMLQAAMAAPVADELLDDAEHPAPSRREILDATAPLAVAETQPAGEPAIPGTMTGDVSLPASAPAIA